MKKHALLKIMATTLILSSAFTSSYSKTEINKDAKSKYQFLVETLNTKNKDKIFAKKSRSQKSLEILSSLTLALGASYLAAKIVNNFIFNNTEISDPFFNDLPEHYNNLLQDIERLKISFYISLPTLIISYIVFKKIISSALNEEITHVYVLNKFISEWQKYKELIPQKVHEKFDELYSSYLTNGNTLKINETEAKEIIEGIK